MPAHADRTLNRVLIRIYRSLLQYVGECWPWTPATAGTAEQNAINALVNSQQASVARLAEFLANREWPVTFGVYPAEFTDLHYVSLEFLLSRLVTDQNAIVTALEQVQQAVRDDPHAAALLHDVTAAEKGHLYQLRELAKRAPAAV